MLLRYVHEKLSEMGILWEKIPPLWDYFDEELRNFSRDSRRNDTKKFFCADKNYGIRCSNIHMYNSTIKRLGYDWQYPPQEQIW